MRKLLAFIAVSALLFCSCAEAPSEPPSDEKPVTTVVTQSVSEQLHGYSLEQLGCQFNSELSDLSMRYLVYNSANDDHIYDLGINYTHHLGGGLTFAVTYLPWNDNGAGTPVIVSVLQGFKKDELTDNSIIVVNKSYLTAAGLKDYGIYETDEYIICDFTLLLAGKNSIEEYLKDYEYETPVEDYSTGANVYYHIHDGIEELIGANKKD